MAIKITLKKPQVFMKSNVFQLSHGIKNIRRSKLYHWQTHWRKDFLLLLLLEVCGWFLFGQSKKKRGIVWSVLVFFAFTEVRRLNEYCLWEVNLVFYMYIKFNVIKCRFIVKNSSLKCRLYFRLFLCRTSK